MDAIALIAMGTVFVFGYFYLRKHGLPPKSQAPMESNTRPAFSNRRNRKTEMILILFLCCALSALLLIVGITSFFDDSSGSRELAFGITVAATGCGLLAIVWFLGERRRLKYRRAAEWQNQPAVTVAEGLGDALQGLKVLGILVVCSLIPIAVAAFVVIGIVGLLMFGIRQLF
jgi:hypothetical protein